MTKRVQEHSAQERAAVSVLVPLQEWIGVMSGGMKVDNILYQYLLVISPGLDAVAVWRLLAYGMYIPVPNRFVQRQAPKWPISACRLTGRIFQIFRCVLGTNHAMFSLTQMCTLTPATPQ